MIRTVILGAETAEAGELIRILAMHPDVEIVGAQSYGNEGVALTSLHHGLIGETSQLCTVHPNPERCDMILDFSADGLPELTTSLLGRFPDAKVIRLARTDKAYADAGNFVYALPEINRKALVRGASAARIPRPLASTALVALYPLASHLLLPNADITLHFDVPAAIADITDVAAVEKEIGEILRGVQMSWNASVTVTLSPSNTRRSITMSTDIPMQIELEIVAGTFEMYDDHHFAFGITTAVGPSEVAGTEKCVVSLSRPEGDNLHIEAVADARMRGGAGEAVHVLNLLAGLHERTGLALKAIDFLPLPSNSNPD